MTHKTLIAYPHFSKKFDKHPDASDFQLGVVIIQEVKKIVFYSRKLTKHPTRYKETEKELLSIVENLRYFCTILLGQELKIYTNHKNLFCKTISTDRVLRCRLILNQYIPEIEYTPGEKI